MLSPQNREKEFASPRITKSTPTVGYKDELPKARVNEGASQVRRDWAKVPWEYVSIIYTRCYAPLKEPS